MRLEGTNTLAQFIQQVRRIQDPSWDGKPYSNSSGEQILHPDTNVFAHYPTRTVVFFNGNQPDQITPEELSLLRDTGVNVEDLNSIFGKDTHGNLIYESDPLQEKRHYCIESNKATIGDSNGTELHEECDRTVILNSEGFHGREAHDNLVVKSPEVAMWRSHYGVIRNSGTTQQPNGKRVKSVIHNADEVKADDSPGLQVVSSDTSTYTHSGFTRARFASLTKVKGSPGTDLFTVYKSTIENSPKFKGSLNNSIQVNASEGASLSGCEKATLDRSPRFIGNNSIRLEVSESPDGLADNVPYGKVRESAGTKLTNCPESELTRCEGLVGKDSFGIKGVDSPRNFLDKSPDAELTGTSDSKFLTSCHPVSTNDKELTVDNCDDGTFKGNVRTLAKDSYGLNLIGNIDTRIIDSIEATATGNTGLVAETCAHSIFQTCNNFEVANQQNTHYQENVKLLAV